MYRFAPTPSGYLHIGNAFNFLLNWLIAREQGVMILLRIDDLDAARRRDEYVEDIFRSIDALGLDYDQGPSGPDDFYQNWSQHKRLDLYHEHLQKLREAPECYACGFSRKQIQQLKADGTYEREAHQQGRSLGEAGVAWRMKTGEAGEIEVVDMIGRSYRVGIHAEMQDFVVRKKDGMPAYQIASLIDDIHFGVTGIVRGEDLLASTAAQIWLAGKIGQTVFSENKFLHHPLVTLANEKLSKSAGATALKEMLRKPEDVFALFGKALGLTETYSLSDIQGEFDINKLKIRGLHI